MAIPLLIVGLIGIWFAAEIVITNSLHLSEKMKIHPTFIGLTILSIGTSLPEIATHIAGGVNILKGINILDSAGIALGTNIGSNIIQITLITGLVALFGIIKCSKSFLKRDYIMMLAAILLLFIFALDGSLGRVEGLLLLAFYLGYLVVISNKEKIVKKARIIDNKITLHIVLIIVGLLLLAITAKLVLDNALILTHELGVSGSFIGVLIVGVATALPELSTALKGVIKKSTSISLGVLIGSNITNPMLGAGLGSLIAAHSVDKTLQFFDLPFWLLISAAALIFFWKEGKVSKKAAIMLIIAYPVYFFCRLWISGII